MQSLCKRKRDWNHQVTDILWWYSRARANPETSTRNRANTTTESCVAAMTRSSPNLAQSQGTTATQSLPIMTSHSTRLDRSCPGRGDDLKYHDPPLPGEAEKLWLQRKRQQRRCARPTESCKDRDSSREREKALSDESHRSGVCSERENQKKNSKTNTNTNKTETERQSISVWLTERTRFRSKSLILHHLLLVCRPAQQLIMATHHCLPLHSKFTARNRNESHCVFSGSPLLSSPLRSLSFSTRTHLIQRLSTIHQETCSQTLCSPCGRHWPLH